MSMQFEWDEEKNKKNLSKHGVSFEGAQQVFESPHITKIDDRKEYGEIRHCTMGTLGEKGRVVLVVHTLRDNIIRIISMRKANEREQRIFRILVGDLK